MTQLVEETFLSVVLLATVIADSSETRQIIAFTYRWSLETFFIIYRAWQGAGSFPRSQLHGSF